MGKNDNQKQKKQSQEGLLETLGDFTSKENWDSFFTIRGSGDPFEWYAEWADLKTPLLSQIASLPSNQNVQILVPGCGNSRLSEYLYDEGYRTITNIDFSKVAISGMLRRNVRHKKEMKWRVMDMTNMQLDDESFDIVVDKGGLDALMEPGHGPKLGNQYLSEVKRVLKLGGKFICLTLGESHVLDLLLPKFRYGWKMSIHAIPQKTSKGSSLQTLMVIAEKDNSAMLCPISSFMMQSFVDSNGSQAKGVSNALDTENDTRLKHSSYSDIIYTLEDLKIGAKGKLEELNPGRRVQLTLGELGTSSVYRAVLLDAPQDSGPFVYDFGAFLVPKTRARDWLFSSEEGQWLIVDNSKAARLVMIFLDVSHASLSMDEIQKDLSPLVKQLAHGGVGVGVKIPFLAASDGIKERSVVHQATSTLTGPIIVDDVIYENVDDDISTLIPSKDVMFRRLTFERSECLVQSEAVLTSGGEDAGLKDQKKTNSRKEGNPEKSGTPSSPNQDVNNLKVDHNYLASSYHTAIISGFMLISAYLGKIAATGSMVKTSVIGLGAGLLPMFLRRSLPVLNIEVLELDPVVRDLARDYFGFIEDKHLKVHITDGIKHIEEAAKKPASMSESCTSNGGHKSGSLDILIVDVDSSDSSSGISCPAPDFLEESFLLAAKNSLSEQGLFVINLVSRSQDLKEGVFSRLKKVFGQLFSLQLEEDVNEVVFAIKSETCLKEDDFSEACNELARLLTLEKTSMSNRIIDYASKIKILGQPKVLCD